MSDYKLLNGPIIEPASKKVKNIVLFLHGYGANGSDLINIASEWIDILPDTIFYSPNAPFICDINPEGFQWFKLLERTEKELKFGKLYIGTRWGGVDCQSKEKVLTKNSEFSKTNRLPIRNPATMTAYERKYDPYASETNWNKYKLVCDGKFYKTKTNQSSYDIFATKPPYGMTIYQHDLDKLGKSYKEAHQR